MNNPENPTPKALVIGVGAEQGLGGALCKRFAQQGHQVFVAGRTQAKIDKVTSTINNAGDCAYSVVCDATDEVSVINMFDQVESEGEGELDLVVYNVGNSTPGKICEMDAAYFIKAWELLCLGGFLVGKEVAKRMLPAGGTLIYTGASASLRGKAGFAAFNSGKAALRTFAQALAKECGSEGLHVGHVIIDGGIAGQKQFDRLGEPNEQHFEKLISLEGLTDAYWQLYCQQPQAWTFELDLRTSLEDW